MVYILSGYETVNFDENEIRHIATGMDLVIANAEKNYHFEDREEVLAYYHDLKEKIANVAGWE